MFEDEKVFEFCIEHGISFEQYAFLFLLLKQDFNKPFPESLAKRYVRKVGIFSSDAVTQLIEKDMIDDFNSPGKSLPEFYMVKEWVVEAIKCTETQGEQLWNAYPATFPLPGGVNYTARHAGSLGDKETALATYLKRIGRSKKKHAFVMEMLKKYLRLVDQNKVNSMKLGDWIANQMWDTVNEIEETNYGIETY